MDNSEKLATKGTQDKGNFNKICVEHHYMQTNTNNVNKTCTLLETTEVKYETNISFIQQTYHTLQHGNKNVNNS